MRLIRYFSLTFFLAGNAGLFAQAAPKDAKTYTILYTGRLMGYARTPDVQTINDIPPLADGGDQQDNRIAAKYIKLFQTFGSGKEPVFRLGMGDNFAPDLFARTLEVPPDSVRQPKDRYDFYGNAWHKVDPPNKQDSAYPAYKNAQGNSGNGRATIPYDNVAQFLIRAGYQALVPGKHDFYYGPERLRSLARLLEGNGVRMLGANLIIATARAPQFDNVYPRTPERLQTHPYETGFKSVAPDLADVMLPYKQQFVVKNGLKVTSGTTGAAVAESEFKRLKQADVEYSKQFEDVRICHEPASPTAGNPAGVKPPNEDGATCMQLVAAIDACAKPKPHQASTCNVLSRSTKISQDAVYLFQEEKDQLVAGLNHLFCAKVSAKDPKWTCQQFQVQMPMFWYGCCETESKPDPTYMPRPFALVDSNGTKLAVFGVVDPDLLANVGLLNYGWLNETHRWDTIAKVTPADYALKQSLELCNADAVCRDAHKVVMAQMSYAKAAQLITQFKDVFDAVISEADARHNTGNREISVGPDEFGKDPESPFLLTPPVPFEQAPAPAPSNPQAVASFTPKLSIAKITLGMRAVLSSRVEKGATQLLTEPTNCPGVQPKDLRGANDREAPLGCPAPTVTSSAPRISLTTAAQISLHAIKADASAPPPGPAPLPSDPVRDIALLAMKETFHTDIALLQKRDLFDADRLSAEEVPYGEVQNQLERFLWKGDFLIKLNVTGSTLKKVLKQSKKFDDLDQDVLATEVETGRALVSVGVWKDPKDPDSFYVNGARLDDTLLYSIAASEYLGLGDTGYADLSTPDVPPNIRLEDFKHLYPIAGITCGYMKKLSKSDLRCGADVLPSEYLDSSLQRPFDQTPGFNAWERYRTISKRLKPIPVGEGSSGAEGRAQQRHFWTLNLEYIDFSFTGTYINRLSHVAQTLSGISATGVTTTGNHSLGADHKIRGIYDFGSGTLYALSDSAFSLSSTTSSPVPTITSNVAGFEGGGTLRLFPRPRPSWLMAQYSVRYERQLTDSAPTTVAFKAVPVDLKDPLFPLAPGSAPPNLYIDPPRLSTVFGRLGLRAEFADTYIEMGIEQVDARNLLKSYTFATSSGNIYCFPTASIPLACGTDPKLSDMDKYSITQEGPLSVAPIKPTVATTDYLTGGAYFNFNLKFPIWSKKDATGGDHSVFFQATNKFDVYFNSAADTSVQTRYLGKLTPSLNFPIYGKLVLTPKVDFIMYENKLGHTVYRSMAPSIGISYSFKLREGMDFSRSLGYGAITQTPQTAGTAH